MTHSGQNVAMFIRAAPGKGGPGFIVIVNRTVFIIDFRRQFWSTKSVITGLQRIGHMTPHCGLRDIRAGEDGKDHCRFTGLSNTREARDQRRFYTRAVGLGDRNRGNTIRIGSTTIFRRGGG